MTTSASEITSGRVLRKFDAGGFIVTETLHAANLKLQRHDHENANINVTIFGSFRETIGRRPQECVPSSILVKPAGANHADVYGPSGAHCLIVEVPGHLRGADPAVSRLFEDPAHIKNAFLSGIAMNVHRELRNEPRPSPLLIEGLILELVSLAARTGQAKNGQTPGWLRDVRDLLHQSFAQPLGLSLIADRIGIHPAHLARIFRKTYGCSVGTYILRLRLDRSMRDLIRSERSLSEIASRSGFYDQSHFTNVFRRHTGMTPSEYRRAENSRTS